MCEKDSLAYPNGVENLTHLNNTTHGPSFLVVVPSPDDRFNGVRGEIIPRQNLLEICEGLELWHISK